MHYRWQDLLHDHSNLLVGSITMLIAFGVYWLTLAQDITWANYGVDGGDLITAVITQGNPHPSGYPIYLLLGYLIAKLPLQPIAFRFNLFSALTMAGAASLVAVTALKVIETEEKTKNYLKHLIAIVVGLTVAFASLIWGQAVITEVYGLYMLLVAAYLWALLTKKPAWLVGFFLGLTITAHSTGWLLLPLALVSISKKKLKLLIIGLLLGLLPFALLPLLSTDTSPVAWGDLDTLQGWWWLISSQIYRLYGFSLPPHLWLARLSEWSLLFFAQFTWAGIPLIVAAFFLSTVENRLLYGLLLGTAVLYFFVAFFYNTDDAIVFTLPAWLLLSLLLIPALQRLGWIAFVLPIALILINFQANNLRGYDLIRNNIESLLLEVPEKAILETPGDPTIFTLWYIIYAEGQRPDIIPVDSDLFAFSWYRNRLKILYPGLMGLENDDLLRFQELNEINQPYCFASLAKTNPNIQTDYSLVCKESLSS